MYSILRKAALSLLVFAVGQALAQSAFRVASTLEVSYEGAYLSYGVADFLGNGTVTVISGGFPWPMADKLMPYRAVNISKTGVATDVSNVLFDGSPGQSWGRRGFVADFNGDGRPDFFAVSRGYDTAPFPGDYQLLLLSQANGKLKDESATLMPRVKQFVHGGAVGDVKGNGRPDIFVSLYNATQIPGLDPAYGAPTAPAPDWLGAYMLRNDGSGHFSFDNRTLADKLTFGLNTTVNPWVRWDTPGPVNSAAMADVDGDRDIDLVLSQTS